MMGSRYWELEHLRTGTIVGLLFISGKGPTEEEKGKLGEHFTTEQGYQFARQAGFEVLAAVKEYTGFFGSGEKGRQGARFRKRGSFLLRARKSVERILRLDDWLMCLGDKVRIDLTFITLGEPRTIRRHPSDEKFCPKHKSTGGSYNS